MKITSAFIASVLLLALAACSPVSPINNLALPPVSAIEGTIIQMAPIGFVLADASGSIYVRAQLPNNAKLTVALKEKVRVYGNLEGGSLQRIFDAYIIRKEGGEQIVLNVPNPHLGFVVQSKFQ